MRTTEKGIVVVSADPQHTCTGGVAINARRPRAVLSAAIGYEVWNRPEASVLTWPGLTVIPSQPMVGSVGRLAGLPCGSEHSMICNPVGSWA